MYICKYMQECNQETDVVRYFYEDHSDIKIEIEKDRDRVKDRDREKDREKK